MMWLLLSCARSNPPDPAPAACIEDDTLVDLPPPEVVVLISVDTVNRHFLGVHHPDWDVTPRLDALFAESTLLDHVVVPRGLSGPSMATLVTGVYPRTHGVRVNEEMLDDPVSADTPTLGERFVAAGYHAYGFSANQCYLLDGTMQVDCTWADPTLDQAEGDAILVTGFLEALDARPVDEPFFLWIHFMDPHDPYTAREPWYTEFHPEAYDGPFSEASEDEIAAMMRGDVPYTDADRAHMDAVYASQLKATDVYIGQLLDGLATRERLDDAVVAFGIDHGDELAQRNTYFYHGCSPYGGVIDVSYAIHAPGRVPMGKVVSARVPSVDFAPTLVDLAGLEWSGAGEGHTLLPDLVGCVEPDRAAYFERGRETAGIVVDGYKYFLDPNAGYSSCKHFSAADPFPNAAQELYDLAADPLELDNLLREEPELAADLRRRVCAWVLDGPWGVGDAYASENVLVEACER